MKLSRQIIAEGGLQLLAEGGLENLSTRKLADHFGIKSASLYYHFKNKQALLDHVADEMASPAWRPIEPDETWQVWLISIAKALRGRMLAFPDGALLYAGATAPSDRMAERLALIYAPTMAAGLSRAKTRQAMLTVIRYTVGWAVDEQTAKARGVGRDTQSQDDFEVGLHILVRGVETLFVEEGLTP